MGVREVELLGAVRPWTTYGMMQWFAEYRIDVGGAEMVHAVVKQAPQPADSATMEVTAGGAPLAWSGRMWS